MVGLPPWRCKIQSGEGLFGVLEAEAGQFWKLRWVPGFVQGFDSRHIFHPSSFAGLSDLGLSESHGQILICYNLKGPHLFRGSCTSLLNGVSLGEAGESTGLLKEERQGWHVGGSGGCRWGGDSFALLQFLSWWHIWLPPPSSTVISFALFWISLLGKRWTGEYSMETSMPFTSLGFLHYTV